MSVHAVYACVIACLCVCAHFYVCNRMHGVLSYTLLCACVRVRIYIMYYTQTHTHTRMHTQTHMCIYVYVFAHVHMCAFILYVCMCVCICTCTCICTYTYLHACAVYLCVNVVGAHPQTSVDAFRGRQGARCGQCRVWVQLSLHAWPAMLVRSKFAVNTQYEYIGV